MRISMLPSFLVPSITIYGPIARVELKSRDQQRQSDQRCLIGEESRILRSRFLFPFRPSVPYFFIPAF